MTIAGRPEEVRERCEALLAAGLDGLLFATAGSWTREGVTAVGEAVAPLR